MQKYLQVRLTPSAGQWHPRIVKPRLELQWEYSETAKLFLLLEIFNVLLDLPYNILVVSMDLDLLSSRCCSVQESDNLFSSIKLS